MEPIYLSGIVGIDFNASSIRQSLQQAKGKDVNFVLSSPGGIVPDAFEIFNLLKNYPGQKTVDLSGYVMSAATYIIMAMDKIRAEKNTVFMIHNPYTIALGDYRDMKKASEVLDGLTNLMTQDYANRTGKSVSEIRNLLDAETYLYGEEISDNGFANETIEPKDPIAALASRSDLRIKAEMSFKDSLQKQRDFISSNLEIYENRLVAFVKDFDEEKIEKFKIDSEFLPKNLKEETKLTYDELVSKHPEIVNRIKNEGETDGIKKGIDQEYSRVQALQHFKTLAGEKGNLELDSILNSAIAERQTPDQILPKVQVAVMKGLITGATPPTAASSDPAQQTSGGSVTALSDEEKIVAKKMGVTEEKYAEYKLKVSTAMLEEAGK